MMQRAPLLSLVVPVYFNSQTLPELHRRIRATFDGRLGEDELEILFVDDGSLDDSFRVICELAETDPARVRVLRMSRNFGSHAAILAGFSMSRGRYGAIISADLQDSSDMVWEMLSKARTSDVDVVIACRAERRERYSKVAFANLYYWMMRTFSQAKFPPGGFDCYLIERKVIDAVVTLREANTSLPAQILWMGFRQAQIEYVREEREEGRSRWTLRKKLRLLADSIISFSHAPIRAMETAGLVTTVLSFLYMIFLIVRRLNGIDREIAGWTALMVVVLFLGGMNLLFLGVVGEYLWRILDAARHRPVFLVSETRNVSIEKAPPQWTS